MTADPLKAKIITAYQTLLARDGLLLQVDASERSITHKLAEYLQQLLPDWNVDCEYNRTLGEGKLVQLWSEKQEEVLSKLESAPTDKRRKFLQDILDGGVSVYPDIIIHHRGTSNNLAVIEAKKSSSTIDDSEKLQAYINDERLNYQFAFKVILPAGRQYQEPIEFDTIIEQITP
ncbi:MAG: hypothetical protein TR69_WS6001000050 [candidate division WS6 bacterium OLB20]|uniref:Uncharacterized protein n=1 Tax=candidate division WS6 bacterium OLB20 TaxID=1617426 RepID=A0A136M151_9BACT|nr:MAG: hypothetical protein TR69_WS6001000050 [candidate division WS6 bacterium OLB20]